VVRVLRRLVLHAGLNARNHMSVTGCSRCAKPLALIGDKMPADGLCLWCRCHDAPGAAALMLRDSGEYDRGRREGRADVGKYANAIGRIDCALGIAGAEPLDSTVKAVEALVLRADTDSKAKAAWESLYNERNRLWRDAEDKLDLVRGLLERNGCDCECDHDAESHDDDCERCLACRIAEVVR